MSLESLVKYPAVFLCGLAVALLLTPAWRRLAPAFGFVDRPGGRKIHQGPVPVGGGVAIFLGFHAACAVVFLPAWRPFSGQVSMDWWIRFLPLSAGVLALGLWDDRFGMAPQIKLAGQTLWAVGAYLLDIRIQNVLGYPLPAGVDFLGTVLWFLAMMNSFNLIDGLDGLAAGIALIASAGIAATLVFREAPTDVLLFAGFGGACLGFLRYNFYPASVFLGDAGSLLLGFTLAALAISTHSKGPAVAAIGIPMLAAGVPLFDTLLAVWRRSVRRLLGAGPADGGDRPGVVRGDAEHLHHRLLREGRSHGQVAWMLYGVTAFLSLLGILATVFHDRVLGVLGLGFLVAAYAVFRHLAWIELFDSGEAILRGLARPVRRNRAMLFYVASDLLVLNLGLVFVLYGLEILQAGGGADMKRLWLRHAPLDVSLPFLLLILSRSYSRVWYLARVSEYVATGAAVGLGYAAAFGFHLLGVSASGSPAHGLARYVLLSGLTAPLIVGLRAAPRVVQDLVSWLARGRRRGPARRALVCGAGHRAALFLRLMSLRPSAAEPLEVVGIVDRDDSVRGHTVHGFRVLGTLRDLPRILRERPVETVYIVEDLDADDEARVRSAVRAAGKGLVCWRITETG